MVLTSRLVFRVVVDGRMNTKVRVKSSSRCTTLTTPWATLTPEKQSRSTQTLLQKDGTPNSKYSWSYSIFKLTVPIGRYPGLCTTSHHLQIPGTGLRPFISLVFMPRHDNQPAYRHCHTWLVFRLVSDWCQHRCPLDALVSRKSQVTLTQQVLKTFLKLVITVSINVGLFS